MFFILSKVLKFVIAPLNWMLLLLLLAIFTGNERNRKRYLYGLLFVVVVFTNPYLCAVFMSKWQVPAVPYTDSVYDAAIVLGGITGYDAKHDRVQFLRGADRLFQAIDLYKEGKVKKIIFTGGSGYVLNPEYKEGALLKPYVLKLGVVESDFLIENESRNTHENAVFTKQLLDKETITGRMLLITSGFHMRRSMACFNKENVFPEPYSADIYEEADSYVPTSNWVEQFMPSVDTLASWTNFIHEIIGYVVYKIVGYA